MSLVTILNGPNLNLLGLRQPEIYGTTTLRQIEEECHDIAGRCGLTLEFRQSNYEGQIVDWVQDAFIRQIDGVIINAAAYTHTSVAIYDALKMLSAPVIELHISNPKERESFRHHSYIESIATAHVMGHGAAGYSLAVEKMAELLKP